MATYAPTHAHPGHHHHIDERPLSYWWTRAFAWTTLSFAAGFAIVYLLRLIFTFNDLWEPQVYYTVAAAMAGIGFTIGIGCWDYWFRWLTGRHVDPEDHSFHGATSWKHYFRVNTDHKVIGIQYLVSVLAFLLVGGLFALLVRLELATPGETLGDGETFNGLFSVHATVMIFLVLIPAFAALGNFALPLMIGAKDMAFPRANALSFWLWIAGAGIVLSAPFVGMFSSGWTAYVPLSTQMGTGQTVFQVGIQFLGAASIMTAINIITTVVTMRAPGMTVWRMPLFVWSSATQSALVVFATPFIAGSQFLSLFDRVMGTHFFNAAEGGDIIMYQHIFWFYSHPAVYIMILPGFGLITDIVATFARKPAFGYRAIAFSTVAIAVLGFGVWAHHMFVSGMASWIRVPMMFMTVLIAVPTGVKIFAWLGTMWRGKIHFKTPMLFAMGFIISFVLGGLSGVMVAIIPTVVQTTETYFVVAHIHYVFVAGSVLIILAGIFYFWPKMTGRMYNERLGQITFWVMFIGMHATFFPMHWLGIMGMPRRVAAYDERFYALNVFISISALFMGVAILMVLYNLITSLWKGEKAPWNPWRSHGLEWQVSSPPPMFNFDAPPQVVGGPYQYGIPGARHAVVFAPIEIGGGELEEVPTRTILVIANQTAASQPLFDQIRRLAAEGFWRFTFAVPAGTGDPQAAERRMQMMLSALAEQGIDASGVVVPGADPMAAVQSVIDEEDVQELLLSTFPTGESPWMDEDILDRLRKSTGLGISRVVVRPEEALRPLTSRSVERVAVIADSAFGGANLARAIVEHAGPETGGAILLAPMDLDGPGWTDDVAARRDGLTTRMQATIGALGEAGISADGEVIDGSSVDAVRIALSEQNISRVLLVVADGDSLAGSGMLEAVRDAAGHVPVDRVVVDAEAPAAPAGS
ncbi:MAG TPA: cytochrome c oxidase subunit I [Miltoncostaeaceae bacterium]|nr:cytochrome c oxidase subunit I [Miltoncostaeaceae bacterium]